MSDTLQHEPDQHTDLAPPPDELNPAMIHAHQTFVLTAILSALYIGAILVFVLF